MRVFRKRVVLRKDIAVPLAHDAGDRRILREALLFDEQRQRLKAPAARRHLEHFGFLAGIIEDRPDIEALQQAAPGDVLGQFLDRDVGLDLADVRLAEHQLVERDIARARKGDLLNGLGHVFFSATGAGSVSPDLQPRRRPHLPPLALPIRHHAHHPGSTRCRAAINPP